MIRYVDKAWFKSRKLWVAVAGVVAIIASDAFGIELEPEQIAGVIALLGTYLFNQGWVDRNAVRGDADILSQEAVAQAKLLSEQLQATLAQYGQLMESQTTPGPVAGVPTFDPADN